MFRLQAELRQAKDAMWKANTKLWKERNKDSVKKHAQDYDHSEKRKQVQKNYELKTDSAVRLQQKQDCDALRKRSEKRQRSNRTYDHSAKRQQVQENYDVRRKDDRQQYWEKRNVKVWCPDCLEEYSKPHKNIKHTNCRAPQTL